MQWFSNILQLQFYSPPKGSIPCYCETIFNPTDLMLQGYLDRNGGGSFVMKIFLYSADGQTMIEDVTTYFDYFFALNPVNNRQFFNAKLKGFSPSMCANPCFVLRVGVEDGAGGSYFLYFTERYCVPKCCATVTDVSFAQDDRTFPPVISTGGDLTFPTQGADVNAYVDDCGEVYIPIITYSDCYNAFSGRYYGTPATVYSGTAFKYRNVTYMRARLIDSVSEVQVTRSRNCRIQEINHQNQYRLEGFEYFPAYKMRELTWGFADTSVIVDGQEVIFQDGAPFEQIDISGDCTPLYKLDTPLYDCNVRQILGCNEGCAENARGFIVGKAIMPDAAYYSENRQYIGTTCDDILNYYRTRQGVTSVTAVDPDLYDCDYECAFLVEALSGAYIPTMFYYGIPQAQSAVYGMDAANLTDLCSIVTPVCATPVIGTITIVPTVCATPVIGTITIVTPTPETLSFIPVGDWTTDATTQSITKESGTVVMTFGINNVNYPYSGSGELPFINENILLIAEGGRPSAPRAIVSGDLPAGASLTILPNGYAAYSGAPTSANGTGSTIQLTNITWQI